MDDVPRTTAGLDEARPMRRFRVGLTFKLVVPLTIGMFAVLLPHFALTIRRERQLFETTKEQYGEIIGHALAQRLADTWDATGAAGADTMQESLDELGDNVNVSWMPSDARELARLTADLTPEQRRTLENGDPLTVPRREGGRESFHTYVPVPPPGQGVVVVVDSFSDRDFYVKASVRRFLYSLGLIVIINALLALGLSAWVVARPFSRLMVKARQVGSGNLDTPVKLSRRDEIGELGREMDRMSQSLLQADARVRSEEAARSKVEQELQHAERLATIGKLAAGVAHELGTPLNVISGRAKRVGRGHEDDAELQKNVSIIRDQVDRVTQIVQQLLQFARRRKVSKSQVDVRELIRAAVAELQPTISNDVHFALHLDEPADTNVPIDGRQIQQVLTNLIVNAAQAMPAGGELTIGLSRRRAQPPAGHPGADGEYLCLHVEDKGGGIAEEDLPHIFEPFFTTKDIGRGTGLGLAVSLGIVQDHGGWIDVETNLGQGTRFTVFLPREEA